MEIVNNKSWNWKTQRWDGPDQITGLFEGETMSNQAPNPVQKPMFTADGISILFGEGVFKKGQNYTVRLGDKYAERKGIVLGSIYELADPAGVHLGQGVITHIISCRMRDIPKDVFSNEHDPDCHNPICLFDEMMKCYPDAGINRNTMVTCLGFTLLG
jgi:hypothetical protein